MVNWKFEWFWKLIRSIIPRKRENNKKHRTLTHTPTKQTPNIHTTAREIRKTKRDKVKKEYCACQADRLTYLSWSHMKRHLQCAEQRCHDPTSPNTAPPTKNDTARFQRESPKTGETSFPMRSRSEHEPRMMRAWSEHDPSMKTQTATRLATEDTFRAHHELFHWKIQRFAPNLTFKPSPNTAPATKSDTWTSPNTAPATKSDTWTSPSTAPATKSDSSTSSSTAPATKSDTWTSPNTAPATKSDTWTSPSTAPATKSDSSTSSSTAPATKSDTWTSVSTALATKSDTCSFFVATSTYSARLGTLIWWICYGIAEQYWAAWGFLKALSFTWLSGCVSVLFLFVFCLCCFFFHRHLAFLLTYSPTCGNSQSKTKRFYDRLSFERARHGL